jgi:hypothetical protein
MGIVGRDVEKEKAAKESAEVKKLQLAVFNHMKIWSVLEFSLSSLFKRMLNLPEISAIPFAIYYSPDGFDSRQKIVNSALLQLIEEQKELAFLKEHWDKIMHELNDVRRIRNVIAHGALHVLKIEDKTHVTHCAPPSDINRVLKLIVKGSIPGRSAKQINDSYKKIQGLVTCIHAVTFIISLFYEHGPQTFQEISSRAEARLQGLLRRHLYAHKSGARVAQPQSSSE